MKNPPKKVADCQQQSAVKIKDRGGNAPRQTDKKLYLQLWVAKKNFNIGGKWYAYFVKNILSEVCAEKRSRLWQDGVGKTRSANGNGKEGGRERVEKLYAGLCKWQGFFASPMAKNLRHQPITHNALRQSRSHFSSQGLFLRQMPGNRFGPPPCCDGSSYSADEMGNHDL
ncbi:MAG: hypothetical protein HFG27_00775 [Provencibacterium sp.]|nr:hypothetical protein [Provencibacterium sp.]